MIAYDSMSIIDVTDGQTLYTWHMYADDQNGNGMTSDSTGKAYVGVAYNQTTEEPPADVSPSIFTWSLWEPPPVEVIEQIAQYCFGDIPADKNTAPVSPSQDDRGWSATAPNPWADENVDANTKPKYYVWRRYETRWSNGDTTYVGLMILDDYEVANILAIQAGYKNVGEWCKDKNVTIIDGSTIMTGSITADQIDVNSLTVHEDFTSSIHKSISDIGGRNLATLDSIVHQATVNTNEGHFWNITKTDSVLATYINESILEDGKTYTLSFCFKKTGGTLENIGGHTGSHSIQSQSLDGKLVSEKYYLGWNIPDDDSKHRVVLTFIAKKTESNDHVYIQPNRSSQTDITYDLWDIKVEEGPYATGWAPAPEDMATNATVSSTIKQTADRIELSVAQTIDNIEIGGRNLAEETNQGCKNWMWSLAQTGSYTREDYIDNNVNCCKLTKDEVENTGYSVILYENIGRSKYEAGQTYTVSFDVLSNVSTNMHASLRKANYQDPLEVECTPSYCPITKDQWSKMVYVMKLNSTLPTSMSQELYLQSMNSMPGTYYIFKNLKIEKGNKATDWTPATEDMATNETLKKYSTLEHTADSIKVSVSKVIDSVGGRNYIPNSTDFSILGVAEGITATLNDDGSLTIVSENDNGNYVSLGTFNAASEFINTHLIDGEEFTVSVTMKSPNSTIIPQIYIKSGMGYYSMQGTLSNIYSKVYYTGKWISTNDVRIHLGFRSAIGTYNIKNIKLEKGNKATDWTPAPEDMATKAELQVTADQISTKVESSDYNSKMTQLDDAISTKVSNTSTGENCSWTITPSQFSVSAIASGVSGGITVDANGLMVNGIINAQAGGTIGGWKIHDDGLYSDDYTVGMYMEDSDSYLRTSIVTPANQSYIRFYAGGDTSTGVDAPFMVLEDGSLYANAINVSGGTIGGWTIDQYGLSGEHISGNDTYVAQFNLDQGTNPWWSSSPVLKLGKTGTSNTLLQIYGNGNIETNCGWKFRDSLENPLEAPSNITGNYGLTTGGVDLDVSKGTDKTTSYVFADIISLTASKYDQRTCLTTSGILVSAEGWNSTQSTQWGLIARTPWIAVAKAGSWWAQNQYSDNRLKHEVELIDDRYEAFYNDLSPSRFLWNNQNSSDGYHLGFVAQDVQSCLENNNLTINDFSALKFEGNLETESGYWTLNKEEFISLNTWQIQKLKARVQELENIVTELKAKLD